MGGGEVMLGSGRQETPTKSHLAVEQICHLTATPSPFINWYIVLNVDEDADVECIRKQYHKLALQVHPDKNNHSKADAAFKLLSQAYLCLSDKARRAAFDSQRNTSIPTNPPARKPYQQATRSRFNQIRQQIKELKEEAIVIENCLMTPNAARTETPVFNPSDYQHKGYPHYRTVNCKKAQEFMARFRMVNSCLYNADKNAYPVFKCRPERSPFYA